MDLVQALAERLDLPAEALAAELCQAAQSVLVSGAQGQEFEDTLTKTQIGTIAAALLWNVNPLMRRAVKLAKK